MTDLTFAAIGKDTSVTAMFAKINAQFDKLDAKLDTMRGKKVTIGVNAVGADKATAEVEGAGAAASAAGKKSAEASKGGLASFAGGMTKVAAVTGLAAGFMGVKAVKAAGDFQAQLTRLVTSAGESNRNIGLVGSGILALAKDTGTATDQLTSGMYMIESAGFHGASGLVVLKAAAQGAKAENADLATVTNAVTDLLTDYHLKASDAASVTSKMVEATASGKLSFEELAGSMSAIAPIASASHISMAEMLGDLAEMTSHGVSANQASQNLAQAIRSLSNPTVGMTNELAQLGIRSDDLSQHLGQRGLAGTLQMIEEAVLKNMGPAGTVLLKTFNQSKIAAEDAQQMFKALPPNLQKVATSYKNGTISSREWTLGLKNLSAPQASLLKQWANMQNSSKGFNTQLKAGGPSAQSFTAAMAKATGNATTLNVALQTTGENASATNAKIKAIGSASTEAGNNVKGWADIQQTFNFKMQQTKASFQATAISIGTVLLPAASRLLTTFSGMFQWIDRNRKVMLPLLGIVGGLAIGIGAVTKATQIFNAVSQAMKANPWIFIATAVIALVLAIMHLWKTNEGFRNAIKGIWGDIQAIIGKVSRFFVTVWNGMKTVVNAVVKWFLTSFLPPFRGIWNAAAGAVSAFVTFIKIPLGLLFSFFKSYIGSTIAIFKAGWTLIWDVVKLIWGSFILPYLKIVWAEIRAVFDVFVGILKGIWSLLWNTVVGILKGAWQIISGVFIGAMNVIKNIFKLFTDILTGNWHGAWEDIKGIVKAAWSIVTSIFHGAITILSGVLNGFKGFFVNIWEGIKKGAIDFATGIWHAVVGAFNNMKNGLVKIFKDIANFVFVAPINFVINTVIDKGINGLLSTVGKVFGQHWSVHVNPIQGFQTGGPIPGGYGGGDRVPIMAEPGEWMLTKEQVKSMGGKNALASIFGKGANGSGMNMGGPVRGYGLGGLIGNIIGDIGSGFATAGHAIASGFGAAVHWVRGQTANVAQTILNHTIYPLADKISGKGILGQLPHDVAHKIGDSLVSFLRGQDSKANNAAGGQIAYKAGQGVAQWAPLILKALAALHQSAGWLGTVERRMNQESGGNPNAINRTDINAQRGDPSRGLMQTIMSTFQAYKPAGASNIYDPYSNIYAGLNYALHLYGSLAALNRPGGYANGGIVSKPTLAMLGEAGTEVVLPMTQPQRVRQLLGNVGLRSVDARPTKVSHYHLTVEAKEFTVDDLVRTFQEMEARDGASA